MREDIKETMTEGSRPVNQYQVLGDSGGNMVKREPRSGLSGVEPPLVHGTSTVGPKDYVEAIKWINSKIIFTPKQVNVGPRFKAVFADSDVIG